jgi:hypothetical protein
LVYPQINIVHKEKSSKKESTMMTTVFLND